MDDLINILKWFIFKDDNIIISEEIEFFLELTLKISNYDIYCKFIKQENQID